MPISVDRDTFYSLADIAQLFGLEEEELVQATRAPANRLRAAEIGGVTLVRGDHLLSYLETFIHDEAVPISEGPGKAILPKGEPHKETVVEPMIEGIVRIGEDSETPRGADVGKTRKTGDRNMKESEEDIDRRISANDTPNPEEGLSPEDREEPSILGQRLGHRTGRKLRGEETGPGLEGGESRRERTPTSNPLERSNPTVESSQRKPLGSEAKRQPAMSEQTSRRGEPSRHHNIDELVDEVEELERERRRSRREKPESEEEKRGDEGKTNRWL